MLMPSKYRSDPWLWNWRGLPLTRYERVDL